ncbi:hypothetical protein [Endozoicomonas acroporae]|uniref:hypothetical protein n=1 Tax=Endozoicomonas acroporae TaxID=1701104 RepID=UPI0013D55994|nr:hypothetical protein [Endozoicomonas acroporae]
MSNPLNNSPSLHIGGASPRPPGQHDGAARGVGALGADSGFPNRAQDGIPRNFFGRGITIAEQHPSSVHQGELKIVNEGRSYIGTYLPTGPMAFIPSDRVIREINNPAWLTNSPSAVYTPDSGGAIGPSRNPDAPGFSSEIQVPDHWVNPGGMQPFAPSSDGPKLPKPRTL